MEKNNFDFSKSENQNKFQELNPEEQMEIYNKAYEEAFDNIKHEDVAKEGRIILQALSSKYPRDFWVAIELLEKNPEMIKLTDIQRIAREYFINSLQHGYSSISFAYILNQKFSFPNQFLSSDLVLQAAKKGIVGAISNPNSSYIGDVLCYKNGLPLSKKDLQEAALEGMVKKIQSYRSYDSRIVEFCRQIIQEFSIPDEMLNSSEIQSAAKNMLAGYHFTIDNATKAKEIFNLSSQEIQEASREVLVCYLERHEIDKVIEIKDFCGISDEFVNSKIFIKILKGREGHVPMYKLDRFIELKNIIDIPDRISRNIVQESLVERLKSSNTQDIFAIKDKFKNFKDIFKLPEIQNLAKELIVNEFKKQKEKDVAGIKDAFDLSEESFREAVEEGVLHALKNLHSQYAMELMYKYEVLNSDKFASLVVKNIVSEINSENFEMAQKIADTFLVQESDFLATVKDSFVNRLKNGNNEGAYSIKDFFDLKITVGELSEDFPGTTRIIQELSTIDIQINFEDINIFISLSQFEHNPDYYIEMVKQNPFLLKAVVENRQHGSKLLLKFPEFDEIVQRNIQTLFANKEEIIKQNPEIDPNSAEFRHLMQKRLLAFGRNLDIVKKLKSAGVDLGGWLDFEYEQHFELGEEDEASFSEQIKSPIRRIDQTVINYIKQLNSVIGGYKKELIEVRITPDKKTELSEKLEKMKNQLRETEQAGDESREQGIKKGIISLEKQLEQLKPIAAWDKIIGEINKLQLSSVDLSNLYEDLCKLEEEQKNIGNDQKALVNQKQKIKQQEVKLKEKIVNFDKSLGSFQIMFGDVLQQSFSQDRADAILQEITMAVGEDFDHYRSDLSTIQNLFKDSDVSLEKTPMRIAIASRNPDVDLYLGNYAPCCIRIDSEYHGAESPIADYLTDLGMQNVVVYDEKRQRPVAVAWCFIGRNYNSNEPVLVIDNIEANTDYSVKFKSQLEKELKNYIKLFADVARIKNIIQGPYNNDLEVATLLEVDEKLGGTNRTTGYYLEAEREDGDGEDWEEEYGEDEVLKVEVDANEMYGEYDDDERGLFLRGNRERRSYQKNQ